MAKRVTSGIPGLPALGDTARDKITGYEGVVVGLCEYLTGCNQVLLIPTTLPADGKRPNGEWFDIDRCEITERNTFERSAVSSTTRPGSDLAAPTK